MSIPDRVRVIYLATPPSLFGPVSAFLAEVGLNGPRDRLVLEKPLGHDLPSSQEINADVAKAFDEAHVYRIDHYLGKESVQNLMALRFGNVLFESIWSNAVVDHVQITVAEDIGAGDRAAYYSKSGALRDMVQNHLGAVAVPDGDGSAGEHGRGQRAGRKTQSPAFVAPIHAGRPENQRGARAVCRWRDRGRVRAGLRDGAGRADEDGDLRRAEGARGQLALGGRAVLPADREAVAGAVIRDRHPLQIDPALHFPALHDR